MRSINEGRLSVVFENGEVTAGYDLDSIRQRAELVASEENQATAEAAPSLT